MGVTIRDIAKHTNVSASTVSRVLNNYPRVDNATRALVWEAARELGYSLEKLRRSKVASSIIILARYEQDRHRVSGEFEQVVYSGVQSVFEKQGFVTRLQRCSMRQWEFQDVRQSIGNPEVTGLILLGGILGRNFIGELQELGLPLVVAGAHFKLLNVNCVTPDYVLGMEQSVDHLVARGRRRIAFVNGPAVSMTSEEKLKGFRLALSRHDLVFNPFQAVAGDFHADSGYTQTLQILEQMPELDAIIFADDAMALGGLRALKESRRRVPDDVAVVGFHDFEIARFTDPPLTSIYFDMRLLGVIAAQRLSMLIEEPTDEAWCIVMPTSLTIRESA